MCIYIYICIFLCVYPHIYTYLYTNVYIFICVYIYVCMHINTNIFIYVYNRVWHGFAQANNASNIWNNYDQFMPGGYLGDLWLYTKILDYKTQKGENYRTSDGRWKLLQPKEVCTADPGLGWDDRFRVSCEAVSPGPRAGHGSAFDSINNYIWIYGGYRTYYPYLSTDGAGSGPGTQSTGTGGFIPFPGYNYYLNDLWYYDLTSGLWVEVVPDVSSPSASTIPLARTDCVFLLLGDTNVLFLHGGYADNQLFDDTWYYNISSSIWLQKQEFVYPKYPASCTDDLLYIQENNQTCSSMTWPKHLDRNA
jgi:hypothetical protein